MFLLLLGQEVRWWMPSMSARFELPEVQQPLVEICRYRSRQQTTSPIAKDGQLQQKSTKCKFRSSPCRFHTSKEKEEKGIEAGEGTALCAETTVRGWKGLLAPGQRLGENLDYLSFLKYEASFASQWWASNKYSSFTVIRKRREYLTRCIGWQTNESSSIVGLAIFVQQLLPRHC